jgi:hypothetical protein
VFAGTRTLGSDQLTGISANGPLQVGDVVIGAGIPAGTTIIAISGSTATMSAVATANSANTAVTAYGPWSEMRWEEVGTAPNREIVFQWSNFRRFGTTLTTTNGTNLSFQIRLHENGEIRSVYGNCSPGVGTTTTVIHQVGLRGPTNAFATNVNSIQSVKGTSDWGTAIASTANTQGHPFNTVVPANVITSGLTYQWTPQSGVVASNTTLGTGCGTLQYNSAYQVFADAAVASAALQGNALQLVNTGSGYAGAWLPGVAGALFVTPVTPTVLVTGDDGEVNVTPSVPLPTPFGPQATLRVTGNAIIGFGNVAQTFPGTNAYTPTAGGFLNSALGGFYSWHDYNEAEGGDVQSEEIGGVLYITYNNVESYPGTPTVNPSTMQFQLDLATGNCTMVWVTVDTNTTSTFGSSHLVGVTGPGNSNDPGAINLASATILTVPEVGLLNLAALNRPQQLAGPNNWNLNATNLPVGIGVDIIGLADPAITDLSLFGLGQPGCQLRATLDITGAFLAGGTHAWSFPIPGGAPALNGLEIFAQTAVLDFLVNLTSTQTTNGVKATIGNL